MAQFGRPDSDISVGGWSPYPADPTTLFDKINEVTPNGDTDYIYSSVDEDECEVGLTNVIDPEIGTGHKIRCYVRCPLGSGQPEALWIALVENGTIRGQSAATTVNRDNYVMIEYTLSEAEANAIVNYANLRLRFHITKVNGGEPIQITQAELEVPDAATEFIYGGDIPMGILPDDPKAKLSKSYTGNILLSALPSYTSIGTMIYAGAVPMAVLPAAPTAPLEKSYAGAVALALIPNSTYGLELSYTYAGALALGILPSYESILDAVYAGNIPAILTPSSTRILDRLYSGDIPLLLVPSSTRIRDMLYSGDIPATILPDFPKGIMDILYPGDVALAILPDAPIAPLAKAYTGDLGLVLLPDSIYQLVEAEGGEFVYVGNIPMIALPSYASILDRAYGGDVKLIPLPVSLYSGIRSAPESYAPGRMVKEPAELLLLADRKRLNLISKRKPLFISEEIK